MSRSGYVNTDRTKGRLYSLVGCPHSGKSTWANAWARESPVAWMAKDGGENFGPGQVGVTLRTRRPRVVVAGADFRRALHNSDYVPRAEHLVFSLMDTAIAALLLRGYDVLVDETSTSKPSLMRYLRLDENVELIFIDTPAEECKRRALANGRPELLPVIDRIAPRLENLKANWGTIRADLLSQVEHLVLRD